jgi:hypothetical protein
MFPEMDVAEIAESRIGKRSEDRVREINFAQQCLVSVRFDDRNIG